MADDEMHMLCRMVHDTRYDSLPPSLVQHARHAILDTVAVTIGGSAMDGIRAVVDHVREKGGKPESSIPLHGGKVPASEAALAIGPMARAMDFGDVDMIAGHCSEYVVPALLAALGLQRKVSGREFITAFVVGSEVLVRTGLLAKPGRSLSIGREGGHYIFGCVAAVGKLLGLSLAELAQAQGIASGMTQPHSALMYDPPTLMIRLHHGFTCQDAINACLLARRGLGGPREGILSGRGGYSSFVTWDGEPDRAAVTRGLGDEWRITNLTRKRHPVAGAASTSIDALLQQMRSHDYGASDIDRIAVELDARLAERVTHPKARKAQWHPESVHDCQFSVPYGIAIAASTGEVFLDSYTPEARSRTDVRALMSRVAVTADASLPAYAARITTTLRNGERFSTEYRYPVGHPKRPLTEQDLIEKFRKCARYSVLALSSAVLDSLIEAILQLESSDDVARSLIDPMTPAWPPPDTDPNA